MNRAIAMNVSNLWYIKRMDKYVYHKLWQVVVEIIVLLASNKDNCYNHSCQPKKKYSSFFFLGLVKDILVEVMGGKNWFTFLYIPVRKAGLYNPLYNVPSLLNVSRSIPTPQI